MNTERPDNDDTGSAEERVAGGSAEARGAAEKKGVSEERGVPEEQGAASVETAGEAAGAGEGGGEASGDVEGDVASGSAEAGDAEESAAASDAAETEVAADADTDADERPTAPAPAEAGAETDAGASAGAEPAGLPADAGADDEPADAPDNEVRRDDEAHKADGVRSARRRSPAVVASVAAAVLLVGGGGAYLAATASGDSGGRTTSGASGDDTPPPLALEGYSESGGTDNGIAPGEPNPYGVTYRADGTLPDGPGSAPVYRAQGAVDKEEVAELAEALGVDGAPVAQGQAWRVGAKDGSGPTLQVNQQAPGTWTFHHYTPGTDDAASPVSEAAAKKAAAPVLKALGQDDAKVVASQVMGSQRMVNTDPVVDGMPTYGWTTGVSVNAQGKVVGGSGQLQAPAKGDTYPVLSAEKTLALMNAAPGTSHRMGIGGCATPVPHKDRMEASCESSGTAAKRETITVDKAVFGLASHVVEGRPALVPSWLFEARAAGAKDGFTVTYPAVDPKYITSGEPSGQPSPRPSAPGDEPTAAPAPRDVQVDGYTAEGRELTVAFTGGVCADYKATASESGDKVTVEVTETPWPDKVCILIAKVHHQTVQLDEPLGDRKVVGSDGKAIPLEKPGARLPEKSGAR
ncbi:hypothetical protein [Streptomyces sp. NL15-2K]|uniref:hypothetical protein n=1 Tax=Streptomyces sp. NL15-2K TaxID=376149 RepID=UPI000FF9E13E|nr:MULTISPECIES: hypothetical protein [Actinomycetes]WKX08434.1 hypothetical protein Q4V64_13445 [Kutzneria buriramensis]GCB50083.1 hypothetical protein SNL152K_7426 [Streptomyces sp. NL15-2K]